MQKIYLKLAAISSCVLLLSFGACKKTPTAETPPGDKPYQLVVPPGFPQPYLSAKNPLTEKGVLLGKMLYSDPILSTNGRSCSSCHQRQNSYSKPLHTFQNGFVISV